jgi:hypothetical protein
MLHSQNEAQSVQGFHYIHRSYLHVLRISAMRSLLFVITTLLSLHAFAQPIDLASKANTFLNSLDNKLKTKAHYTFDDGERFNWFFVPRSRNGVNLHDLNNVQREAVFTLLKASLGKHGYQKATDVIALEKILQRVEGREENDSYRDPLNYYFTVFGTPDPKNTWGWRIEGHHLSINFTVASDEIVSSTPSFLGSNPAIVPEGAEKGKQILKDESIIGFQLVNALTPTQQKEAVFSEQALPEIVSGNNRKAALLSPAGLKFSELTDPQKQMFLSLLDVYVKNYELGFANKLMEKIKKAGLENLTFGWAGSLQPGSGYYYRIQGPMLLIEFDNTQNNANHIHTVVRDLTNDFAEDILREHYARDHK